MKATDGWFDALGKPVGEQRRREARDLLVSFGRDPEETALVITVIAREIEHDEPARAFRYARTFIGSDETLVIRTLATLAATTVGEEWEDIRNRYTHHTISRERFDKQMSEAGISDPDAIEELWTFAREHGAELRRDFLEDLASDEDDDDRMEP